MSLPEYKRLRAVRFGNFMDRIDPGHDVPARLEQIARILYVHTPRRRCGE